MAGEEGGLGAALTLELLLVAGPPPGGNRLPVKPRVLTQLWTLIRTAAFPDSLPARQQRNVLNTLEKRWGPGSGWVKLYLKEKKITVFFFNP